jgi:mannosyltransferase OCH1-like enzyme
MTFDLVLLTIAVIVLALLLLVSIYSNRNLQTDTEMAMYVDYCPKDMIPLDFYNLDSEWVKEYILINNYVSKLGDLPKYKVIIERPFVDKLQSLEPIIHMANGAIVIFTDSGDLNIDTFKPDLLITDVANGNEAIEIIKEELSKFCNREILTDYKLCSKISLKELIEIPHHQALLNKGCPVRVGKIAIISCKCLYDVKTDTIPYPRNKHRTTLAPLYQPALKPGYPCKIPKIIHQTYETRVIPDRLTISIGTWINGNPDYAYRYYTGEDCRDFIAEHLPTRVLRAYDTLYPGAFKADLWRCCVLYISGGVYADVKLFPALPLYKLLDPDVDLMVVHDYPLERKNSREIYNAFMASVPGNPFILNVINTIVKNVEERRMTHKLDITGPIVVGNELTKFIKDNNSTYDWQPGVHTITETMKLQMLKVQPNFAIFDSSITRGNNKPVVYHRNIKDGPFDGSKIYGETSGKPHYSKLFDKGEVYTKPINM